MGKAADSESMLFSERSICQPWYQYSDTDNEQRFYKANYELVLEKIIKTYSVDYLTLNVIEHSMHINIMTKQEELARNIEVETDDIRVICTTVHKAKGLEYGCIIMPYMSMDIASMKKADLDVYVENEKCKRQIIPRLANTRL